MDEMATGTRLSSSHAIQECPLKLKGNFIRRTSDLLYGSECWAVKQMRKEYTRPKC